MKKLITFVLLGLLTMSARPANHTYQAQSLAKEEIKLNSASRPGGVTRSVITLQVPGGTEYIYYAVHASPKGPLQDLELHTQLHKHISEQGYSVGLGSTIINSLLMPQGDGVADVYVMSEAQGAANFEAKQDKGWQYLQDYSRLNISSGIVGIPVTFSLLPQTLYLCIKNPSMLNAQFIRVEAEAVVRVR